MELTVNRFLAIRYDLKGDFNSQVGLVYVRGCEVEGLLDGNGRVIEEGPEPRPFIPGDTRTLRVILDSNQYKLDMDEVSQGKEVSNFIKQLFHKYVIIGAALIT